MKYKVGDELIVKVVVIEVRSSGSILLGTAPFGDVDSRAIVNEKELDGIVVERAAAHAAKAAPAPDGWEPKPGDRVLVEGKIVLVDEESGYWISAHHGEQFAVGRSAIVGPAPKRARFVSGETVFCKSTMTRVTVYDNVGKNQWRITDGDTNQVWLADDSDLLTMDEARERLVK